MDKPYKYNVNAVNKISDNDFLKIYNNAEFLSDIIIEAGLTISGSNYVLVKKRILQLGLSIDKFINNKNRKRRGGVTPKSHNEIFKIYKNNHSNQSIKKRILKDNIIQYKCGECGNNGDWNNKLLTLQLDHKNGINTDNRLENLRFLCPNCHSQTDTFAGKRFKREIKYCLDCNLQINHSSKRCKKCATKKRIESGAGLPNQIGLSKISWPTKEEMLELVWSPPSSILCTI